MNTQPQLLPKYKKLNSLQRRLESWLINYQGTLPIDAQLCFEQLGLPYTKKHYKKFIQALWEINNCPDARVSYRFKDFYFAEFEPREDFYTGIAKEVKQAERDQRLGGASGNSGVGGGWVDASSFIRPSTFDVLQSCYKQLAQLSKEDAQKILQSLTIML